MPASRSRRQRTPWLTTRLRKLGISNRDIRNSALIDIASDMPPVVFSKLLGLRQNTADNWHREAEGFGAEYAASLNHQQRR
ncbi:hypothetical protein GCM10009839_04860 [Catenulispora yoronensis]|uniref:Uncharacterized protein n=2 Tax=Catenulispora yoronensis TaxID=450799 RepID=A0ABP5F342_9ACTN